MPGIVKSVSPFVVAIGLFLAAVSPAFALKGINADGTLDKPTISKAYFEGEFWTVISALEAFRKTGMKGTHEDSVYTFKYLSVVYAAEPSTRTKAESYMYQLIKMMPTIDLIDLYISDNIESIFNKVKRDFEKLEKVQGSAAYTAHAAKQDSASGTAVLAKPAAAAPVATQTSSAKPLDYPAAPEKPASAEGKKKSGIKPWVPMALGGACVVAATVTYLIVSKGSGGSGGSGDTPRPVEVTVVTPNQGSQ